jgi:hypothetical protein
MTPTENLLSPQFVEARHQEALRLLAENVPTADVAKALGVTKTRLAQWERLSEGRRAAVGSAPASAAASDSAGQAPPSSISCQLDAMDRRFLRRRLERMSADAVPVTIPSLQADVLKLWGFEIDERRAVELLTGFDFQATGSMEPYVVDGQIVGVFPVWSPRPVPTMVSSREAAERLSTRLDALSEAFVTDAMSDPVVAASPLPRAAEQLTGAFASHLGGAVVRRARFGGPDILKSCAQTASAILTTPDAWRR